MAKRNWSFEESNTIESSYPLKYKDISLLTCKYLNILWKPSMIPIRPDPLSHIEYSMIY
jgi:hypothetical protein